MKKKGDVIVEVMNQVNGANEFEFEAVWTEDAGETDSEEPRVVVGYEYIPDVHEKHEDKK